MRKPSENPKKCIAGFAFYLASLLIRQITVPSSGKGQCPPIDTHQLHLSRYYAQKNPHFAIHPYQATGACTDRPTIAAAARQSMRFKRETSTQSKKSIMTALSDAVLQIMAVQTNHMINKVILWQTCPALNLSRAQLQSFRRLLLQIRLLRTQHRRSRMLHRRKPLPPSTSPNL